MALRAGITITKPIAGGCEVLHFVTADAEAFGPTTEPEFRLKVWFDDGQVVREELSMAGGLTPSALQRFPWSRWLAVADAYHRAVTTGTQSWQDFDRTMESTPGWAAPADSTGRPWSTTRNPSFYAEVATRYLELRKAGEANPTRLIAAEQQQNRNTVAGWVRKARQLGYLPQARPGRAG